MLEFIKHIILGLTVAVSGFLPSSAHQQLQSKVNTTPQAVIASPSSTPMPSVFTKTFNTSPKPTPLPTTQSSGGLTYLKPDYSGGYVGYDSNGNQVRLHPDGAGGYIGQDSNGNQIHIPAGQYRTNDSYDNSYDLQSQPTPYTYTYQTPTPEPIYQPKTRTCTQSGDYTYCSDGTSFLTNGSSTYINGNGKSGSCITSGSYTSCSDGSSGIQNGNYGSYYGNGTSGSCIKNGAWTNCSDGSSTYNSNY